MQKKGLASLVFMLGANISEFQTEFRKAEREMQRFGKNMQKIGRDLTASVTLPIVALGTGAVMSFRTFNESMKQVQAGIESTGGAAGYTADQLRQMAKDLGSTTNTLNATILSDVTAQLLTFTNVAGKSFERAQTAIVDVSARMKTDLKSSAIMVGKALNDPIQGLTALRRVGIQFTDDQENVIRSLTQTGQIAEAQGAILDELERQFGGSGKAAGDALTGLANDMKMLGQEFGEIIIERLTPFVDKIRQMIQGFSNLSDQTKGVVVVVGTLAAAIGPILLGIGFLAKTLIPTAVAGLFTLRAAFVKLTAVMLANPFIAVAAGIAAVVTALVLLRKRTNEAADSNERLRKSTQEYYESLSRVEKIYKVFAFDNPFGEDAIRNLDKFRGSIRTLTRQDLVILRDYLKEKIAEAFRSAGDSASETSERIREGARVMQKELSEVNKELAKFKTETDEINDTLSQTTGLINGLNEELKGLREKLSFAETEGEIASLNDQIEELQGRLERLQNISAKAMGQLAINADLAFQRMASLPGVIDVLPPTLAGVNNSVDEFGETLTDNVNTVEMWAQALKSNFEQIAEGFFNLVFDLASGNITFKGMLSGLFNMLGDISIQLGRTAIAVGITVESIKEAIKSLSGIGAILAGGVLLSLGRFIKSYSAGMAPKMAGGGEVPPGFYGDKYPALLSSGEIVVPPRKLEDFLGKFLGMNPAPMELLLTVNGKLSGNDILMSVERAARNRKMNIGR